MKKIPTTASESAKKRATSTPSANAGSQKPAAAKTSAPAMTAPAAKKTATPKQPAAAKKTAASQPSSAAKRAAPAKNKAKQKETVVVACVDVGYGNELFLRGDGPGLSWDRGTRMSCSASDCWTWSSSEVQAPFECKIVLNDEQWSHDENVRISPGETRETTPAF